MKNVYGTTLATAKKECEKVKQLSIGFWVIGLYHSIHSPCYFDNHLCYLNNHYSDSY
jgi:hypothetical protein